MFNLSVSFLFREECFFIFKFDSYNKIIIIIIIIVIIIIIIMAIIMIIIIIKTQLYFEYRPLIDNSFKSFKQINAPGNYERIYRMYNMFAKHDE